MSKQKAGGVSNKGEAGAIVRDVNAGYVAFCKKHNLPLPKLRAPKLRNGGTSS
jgi:hypothetical protein